MKRRLERQNFSIDCALRNPGLYRPGFLKNKESQYDELSLNREIKRQLMRQAKIVYDTMIAAGVDLKRVGVGQNRVA